ALPSLGTPGDTAELEAIELARRVAASDLGGETLARLEAAVDDIATAYPAAAPADLLGPVRGHLGYVRRLVDARATLDQRRRLLVVGGWLSLLAATLYIDLERYRPARGWLGTAADLAQQTGHDEIHAWRYETEAWQVLTVGDYRRAVELSQAAQRLAPRGSSAQIQATAQEGRVWARLGEPRDTYAAIDRVQALAGSMPPPDRPEHHYRYDPTKALAYTATTLAWAGDVAAEGYARESIARLQGHGDVSRWPRRVASSHLDWRSRCSSPTGSTRPPRARSPRSTPARWCRRTTGARWRWCAPSKPASCPGGPICGMRTSRCDAARALTRSETYAPKRAVLAPAATCGGRSGAVTTATSPAPRHRSSLATAGSPSSPR
ncbi:MAG: hypothetical protein ACRDT0_09495, partial [Pseudonocardiaceae bacterium]